MAKLHLCAQIYLVAPCKLHAMNIIFANSVKAIFGECGLDFRYVMQLLHSLYDLVGRYKPQQVMLMWEVTSGEPPPGKICKAAVLTIWGWVNVAAQHLKDNWVQWRALAQGALNSTTVNTASGKIASSILSLIDETKIRCDLYFMVAFSQSYFVRHMNWLQMIDKRAGNLGYLSRHMPVTTYLIIHDLDNLANGWEDYHHYQEFTEFA
jgi:hypothetical protein